jgi:hypothetical protein
MDIHFRAVEANLGNMEAHPVAMETQNGECRFNIKLKASPCNPGAMEAPMQP